MTDGKVAIVTGAAHGIGQAVAARLCGDGCHVALIDVDEDACVAAAEELTGRGYRALPIKADVTDLASLSAAARQMATHLGPASIVVSNAGFARDASLDAMSLDDWDTVQAVHLRALFYLTKLHLPHMKRQGWGRLVAVSSISANGHPDRANYCAAKAGIEGFIRSAAVELGPFGITANAVAPGLIVTGMTKVSATRRGVSLDEHVREARSMIPVGRTGTPGDIAHAISFFASEQAGFVTGQVLTVSGGVIV